MIDIETLDILPTSAIVSIGAVMFEQDGTGIVGDPFYENITFDSALKHGTYSESTIQFWERQPEAAREKLFDPEPIDLGDALKGFHKFVKQYKPKPAFIWAMSPRFDIEILHHAHRALGLKFPFTPWKEMDVRTLKNMIPKEALPRKEGVVHTAVDDCKWQVAVVQLFNSLLEVDNE